MNGYTYLVTVPPPLAEAVQKALNEAGVTEEDVLARRYSGY
jgi:hypothetical protein